MAVLRSALDAVGDDASRARLLALLAVELTYAGDYPARRALSDEALALARHGSDPATLAFVMMRRADTIWVPETRAERGRLTDEMLALADELGDPHAQAYAFSQLMVNAWERGDFEGAALAFERWQELATRIGNPAWIWGTTLDNCLLALMRGEVSAAEAMADESLRVGTETGQPDVLTLYGALLQGVRWHQGRFAELEPLLASLVVDTPHSPFAAILALSRMEAGDDRGARELLEAFAANGFGSIALDQSWTLLISLWAEVAVHLQAVDAAAVLRDLLRPYPDFVAYNGVAITGPIADQLGILETLLGNDDQADAYFDQAMALHERFKAPFFLARTLLHRAELYAKRDAPGDHERSLHLLDEAGTIARRHGYAGIERQVQALRG